MIGFKKFLLESQIQQEVKETIRKLPKSHQELVKGYKFTFEGGCTLKGSKDNVGMIVLNDKKHKEVRVASPWNYGRQFTLLHELAHLVYEKWMARNEKLKKKWESVVKKTKNKLNQPADELWCMAYANHFAKNKVVIHDHPEWKEFINEFIKETS